MKTKHLNSETVERNWYLVDAEDLILGRMSTQIAMVLRGKNKPTYSPHVDGGDFVVVVNAEKIKLTGLKMESKKYFSHSGYIGSGHFTPVKEMLEKHPDRVIRKAVWGMLPKGRLGRKLIKKLKVYAGPEHPHKAQKPEPLTF